MGILAYLLWYLLHKHEHPRVPPLLKSMKSSPHVLILIWRRESSSNHHRFCLSLTLVVFIVFPFIFPSAVQVSSAQISCVSLPLRRGDVWSEIRTSYRGGEGGICGGTFTVAWGEAEGGYYRVNEATHYQTLWGLESPGPIILLLWDK